MENRNIQYTEDPFLVSRRQFITIGGIVVALLALPAVWLKIIVSSKNDYILARTRGLYSDDEKATIRVSHANKAVARYYKEFGGAPLGELSEELLHTKYVDRTRMLS
jgi:ferredoxin hydrogenase small subunit